MTNIDVQVQTVPGGGEAESDALRRKIGMFLAPGIFMLILLLPFPQLTLEAHRLAAIMALVIVLWVTEVMPLPVAALLGPVLAVMLGVARVGPAFAQMANPLIFLFIGSFILAEGLFVHRVNERIAYGVLSLKFVGARPGRILLAYAGIAAFLSAWMSNTATAAMLLPIGLSLLAFMESNSDIPKSYGTALLLAMAYATGRGGMATPVGTPPNLIAVGMIENLVGIRISFVEWMLFAVPIAIVLVITLFVYLTWIGGVKIKDIPGAEQIIPRPSKGAGTLAARRDQCGSGVWRHHLSLGGTGTATARARTGPSRDAECSRDHAGGGGGADRCGTAVRSADKQDAAVDADLETGGPDRLGDPPALWRRALAWQHGVIDRFG